MPNKRRVDILVPETGSSILTRLKKRRDAIESGDLEGANDAFKNAQTRDKEKTDELDTIREEQDTEEKRTRSERRKKEYGG